MQTKYSPSCGILPYNPAYDCVVMNVKHTGGKDSNEYSVHDYVQASSYTVTHSALSAGITPLQIVQVHHSGYLLGHGLCSVVKKRCLS